MSSIIQHKTIINVRIEHYTRLSWWFEYCSTDSTAELFSINCPLLLLLLREPLVCLLVALDLWIVFAFDFDLNGAVRR